MWSVEQEQLATAMRGFAEELVWASYQRVRIPVGRERPKLLPKYGDSVLLNSSIVAVSQAKRNKKRQHALSEAPSPTRKPRGRPRKITAQTDVGFSSLLLPSSHLRAQRRFVADEVEQMFRRNGTKASIVRQFADMWSSTLVKDFPKDSMPCVDINETEDSLQFALSRASDAVYQCSAFTMDHVSLFSQSLLASIGPSHVSI